MELNINISTENDAFEGRNGVELARILRALADNLEVEQCNEDMQYQWKLKDANGNTCGTAVMA